jgi:hypothetical protein
MHVPRPEVGFTLVICTCVSQHECPKSGWLYSRRAPQQPGVLSQLAAHAACVRSPPPLIHARLHVVVGDKEVHAELHQPADHVPAAGGAAGGGSEGGGGVAAGGCGTGGCEGGGGGGCVGDGGGDAQVLGSLPNATVVLAATNSTLYTIPYVREARSYMDCQNSLPEPWVRRVKEVAPAGRSHRP